MYDVWARVQFWAPVRYDKFMSDKFALEHECNLHVRAQYRFYTLKLIHSKLQSTSRLKITKPKVN